MSENDSAVQTKPFHEWVLDQLKLRTLGAALFQQMLLEISIPALHDEIIAAWRPIAKVMAIDDDRVKAKLLAEKAKAEEKARQKAAALQESVKELRESVKRMEDAVQTPAPSKGSWDSCG
ncbi:MAG: hypothetical protein HY545_00560 [Candidatus Doudnabacteria bacterium]|nr:hypothetical protein [Candidatus Doudnabacteria bacterium]